MHQDSAGCADPVLWRYLLSERGNAGLGTEALSLSPPCFCLSVYRSLSLSLLLIVSVSLSLSLSLCLSLSHHSAGSMEGGWHLNLSELL